MKARILTSVLASLVLLVSFGNLSAGNPPVKVYTNHLVTDDGSTKEYTFANSKTLKPESKTTYKYTTDGVLQERAIYRWNSEKGWVTIQKHNYEYKEDGQLAHYFFTAYNSSGKLLSVSQIESDNANSTLVAQK